jgi:hypothetical protein
MSRTLVAMTGTAGVTATTKDGTPYRPDENGVVYVETSHQSELVARGLGVATSTHLATHGHADHDTSITAENVKEYG